MPVPQSKSAVGLMLYVALALVACGLSHLYDRLSDAGPAVVFTLVDTASAELQQRATLELPPEPANNVSTAVVHMEDATITTASNMTSEEHAPPEHRPSPPPPNGTLANGNATEAVTATSTEHEDIPSFSEWTQKQLEEEAERRKDQVNGSAVGGAHHVHKVTAGHKLRSKNYASPDCGAKIVAANPEAVSAGAVLSASRDEYKLNACTSRIWFVVELCEPIQSKKIELANFELFSSSPKDFTVSVSDRFPSRDWALVGQFQARDERDVQSFALSPHLFGKFVKVEMLSHWGSEHFCPISLFRVYGTSEFEVLATEEELGRSGHMVSAAGGTGVHAPTDDDDVNDDDEDVDDDEPLDGGDSTHNLFGSARDAVMSIVKKAAEVLAKGTDEDDTANQTEQRRLEARPDPPTKQRTCSTPRHLVVCDNCSDALYSRAYDLLSCGASQQLPALADVPRVRATLCATELCAQYGLHVCTSAQSSGGLPPPPSTVHYVAAFLAPHYVVALCNVLAVLDHKVLVNHSSSSSVANTSSTATTTTTSPSTSSSSTHASTQSPTLPVTGSDVSASMLTTASTVTSPTAAQIDQQQQNGRTRDHNAASMVDSDGTHTTEASVSVSATQDTAHTHDLPIEMQIKPTKTLKDEGVEPSMQHTITAASWGESTAEMDSGAGGDGDGADEIHEQLDKLFSDMEVDVQTSTAAAATSTSSTLPPPMTSTTAAAGPTQAQKESVFLRLSNRIKALERNMSLSGQYLEELSRRYKRQVEEMQRLFEKKVAALAEEGSRREHQHQQLEARVQQLAASVDSLLADRDQHARAAALLAQFIFVELLVTCALLCVCWRRRRHASSAEAIDEECPTVPKPARRRSVDVVMSEPVMRHRRPSEEMSLRITGTYQQLLVEEGGGAATYSKSERRRRRKRLLRSQSMVSSALVAGPAANGNVPSAPALAISQYSAAEPIEYCREPSPPQTALATPKPSANGSAVRAAPLHVQPSSPPLFMKTALSRRSKRGAENGPAASSHSPEPSLHSHTDSQDERTSDDTPTRKDKKSPGAGLKRILKRVFD